MLLLYYANWYKGIYEMLPGDRPTDDVINDDERLDQWYDAFVRENARKFARKGAPAGGDWQDASDVASRNSFQG